MSPKKTVLLVDDDETVIAILGPILRQFGYIVMEALSGEDACRQCDRAPVDLAILDYAMPGMTGMA